MNKKITKNDIVDNIYNSNDKIERQNIQFVIDSFISELKKSLESGSTIELRGFGTFEPRLRKGRENARNPKTGENLSVEPHYVAVFRPGKDLSANMWKLNSDEEK